MIVRLDRPLGLGAMPELIDLVIDAVASGASIGFLAPLRYNVAQQYWRTTLIEVRNSERALLVARDERGRVDGSVQVRLAGPANGSHRAVLEKLMVHTRARRAGLGRSLLAAAEDLALAEGKRLMVLDVRSGDQAERLYDNAGWQRAGTVPGYALDTDGAPSDATWWWKELA